MKLMGRTASTLVATAVLASTAAAQAPPHPKPAIGSDQAIGQHFQIAVDPLPEPYKGGAVRNTPLLARSVQGQASLLAYADGFSLLGCAVIGCLLVVLFLRAAPSAPSPPVVKGQP